MGCNKELTLLRQKLKGTICVPVFWMFCVWVIFQKRLPWLKLHLLPLTSTYADAGFRLAALKRGLLA